MTAPPTRRCILREMVASQVMDLQVEIEAATRRGTRQRVWSVQSVRATVDDVRRALMFLLRRLVGGRKGTDGRWEGNWEDTAVCPDAEVGNYAANFRIQEQTWRGLLARVENREAPSDRVGRNERPNRKRRST